METVVVAKAVGMGVGGAGVIGATGYGAYKLITPTNIREQLEWNGKVVLDTKDNTNDSLWTTLVGKYPGTPANKLSSLENFTANAENDKKMKELKDACEKELAIKLTNTSDDNVKLKAAEAWCTKQ